MTKRYTGLNIQWPISELIKEGSKTIETRTYKIPEKHLNKDLLMIETPGPKGKFKAKIVAIIRFSKCLEYKTQKDFYKDTEKHCVTPDSDWAWKDKRKYGWVIEKIELLPEPKDINKRKGIVFTNDLSL